MMKTLIFIFLLFAINETYSCSCAGKPPVKENWDYSSEVFKGKVIKVDTLLYGNNGAKIYSYTIQIFKSFKEDFYKGRELRTIISQSGAACDFMFDVGKEYLIYAKAESQTLTCSLCSRTNLMSNISNDEIQLLEKLHKEYLAASNELKIVRFENNAMYQANLVKSVYEERIEKQVLIIYLFSAIIILLTITVLIIRKRKN